MAKVFDEDNVHNFWGLSPSIDVLALLHSLPVSVGYHSMLERLAEADAFHLLQLITRRGTIVVRFAEKQGRMLETVTLNSCAGTVAAPASAITELFDLSLLRFQQRDDVAETFRKYNHKAPYDMQKAWDARIRKFYGSRYDYKRNAIDWDYHMRLAQQGTPGLDPSAGSIIHFYHFRRWREYGVAYELRDCKYSQANPTLLSTAFGTRKEYKDSADLGMTGAAVYLPGAFGVTYSTLPITVLAQVVPSPAFSRSATSSLYTPLSVWQSTMSRL
ncbi:TPA: Dynein assembly factor 3, axonemal [Trebouxia sp. C0004]